MEYDSSIRKLKGLVGDLLKISKDRDTYCSHVQPSVHKHTRRTVLTQALTRNPSFLLNHSNEPIYLVSLCSGGFTCTRLDESFARLGKAVHPRTRSSIGIKSHRLYYVSPVSSGMNCSPTPKVISLELLKKSRLSFSISQQS